MKQQTVMNVRKQALFWSGALAAFLGFLWLFDDILLPFIAGMALAYFLDPVADYLESHGISRMWSTVLITLLLLAAGARTVAPVAAAFPGANGRIAFTITMDGNTDIWTMDEYDWQDSPAYGPAREKQVRRNVGLMEFINEIDTEIARD